MSLAAKINVHFQTVRSSKYDQPIILLQSPESRALNVGFIQKSGKTKRFVPGRLNFGPQREVDTYRAAVRTLQLSDVRKILGKYPPAAISTVTVLRETLACRLGSALTEIGLAGHFGDAFIGASHIKGKGEVKTAYFYENIEGLVNHGLWVIAESICVGRNLVATLDSLLSKFRPQEILMICPIASREGINHVGKIIEHHKVSATFVAWGALFGVDAVTKYDMPWGHPDTEPLDKRDQNLVVSMYGDKLCMGGDFGNNYYCPPLARKLYHEQLNKYHIHPKIPPVMKIERIYQTGEILVRN